MELSSAGAVDYLRQTVLSTLVRGRIMTAVAQVKIVRAVIQ